MATMFDIERAAAQAAEAIAAKLHELAFDIREVGLTSAVQARGDVLADAVLAVVHG